VDDTALLCVLSRETALKLESRRCGVCFRPEADVVTGASRWESSSAHGPRLGQNRQSRPYGRTRMIVFPRLRSRVLKAATGELRHRRPDCAGHTMRKHGLP